MGDTRPCPHARAAGGGARRDGRRRGRGGRDLHEAGRAHGGRAERAGGARRPRRRAAGRRRLVSDVLVSAHWLEARLGDPSLRVLEASIAKESYDDAHIPGALWVDHFADLLRNGDETSGEVLGPEQFAALMRRLGIAAQTTVVWYGDRHSSYAIRGLWTMAFYRHPAPVHVLDGGRERWIAEGRAVTAKVPRIAP